MKTQADLHINYISRISLWGLNGKEDIWPTEGVSFLWLTLPQAEGLIFLEGGGASLPPLCPRGLSPTLGFSISLRSSDLSVWLQPSPRGPLVNLSTTTRPQSFFCTVARLLSFVQPFGDHLLLS